MLIGIPREIKGNENRVSMIPAGVRALVEAGHTVWVEASAGAASGFADADYEAAGAALQAEARLIWEKADLIVKVKEPVPSEYAYFRPDLMLFTFLHLAANLPLTRALLEGRVTAVAYETVTAAGGGLPLLTPMSEVAGRLSVQLGAHMLQKSNGGRGVLLGGVPGVLPGRVAVVGGGAVGWNAARLAMAMGAEVTIFDIDQKRMAYLDDVSQGRLHTAYSNPYAIAEALREADLVIGAVLIPGAKAPHVITEAMVRGMKPGSAIVDVSIDQGGCVETVDRCTTYEEPYFERYGVLHCAVANLPGTVPRTSTLALASATLPYALRLADNGLSALRRDVYLRSGLNTHKGRLTCPGVAQAFDLPHMPAEDALTLEI